MKSLGDMNLQSWVKRVDVANLAMALEENGIRVVNKSAFVRTLLQFCADTFKPKNPVVTISQATRKLETMGFTFEQSETEAGKRRLMKALQEEGISIERGLDIAQLALPDIDSDEVDREMKRIFGDNFEPGGK